MSRLTLLLPVPLFLIGCSESPSRFTSSEADGVTHAVNQQGWNTWSDSAAVPINFEREQTYGTEEGSGPAFLGGIRGMAVDSAGTVYVLDAENHRLVAFNPDATVRWSGGRQGEGPGEFSGPRGMVVGESGRLFVANKVGRQIDVWTTDGEFVERHAFAEENLSSLSLVGYSKEHLIVSESGRGDTPQTIHAVDLETWTLAHSFPPSVELKLPRSLSV